MISDDFIKYLSLIKFSKFEVNGYESELLKAYDKNIKNGEYVDKPFADLIVLLPKVEANYGRAEFCREAELLFEKLSLTYTDRVFFVVLFGFSIYRDSSKNIVNGLKVGFQKYINSLVSSCKVYIVFPLTKIMASSESIEEIKLNKFKIGRLEADKLKALIKNETGSDYFDIFLRDTGIKEEKLSHLLAFSKEIFDMKIIDFSKLVASKLIQYDTGIHLNEFYFDALSSKLFIDFWEEFEQEQIVTVACGLSFFDPTYFKSLSLGNGIQIAIYHKINKLKAGWVVPMISGINSITSISQTGVSDINKKSEKIFSALKQESNFSSLLNHFLNFLAKGNYELSKDRFSEAVLYYWIALDTILNNTEEAKSKMLLNRVSALLWYSEQTSHKSFFYKIGQSYSVRSKYVHAGEHASEMDAIFLRRVCQSVLNVLLNVHTRAADNEEITYISWIESIDELMYLGMNNSYVSSDLLEKTGVL